MAIYDFFFFFYRFIQSFVNDLRIITNNEDTFIQEASASTLLENLEEMFPLICSFQDLELMDSMEPMVTEEILEGEEEMVLSADKEQQVFVVQPDVLVP